MKNQKLYSEHTDKHLKHPMCIQRVVGNGVTHIGLFCQQCKIDGTNAWITWLTKQEANQYKKKFKLKQLPTRKSK